MILLRGETSDDVFNKAASRLCSQEVDRLCQNIKSRYPHAPKEEIRNDVSRNSQKRILIHKRKLCSDDNKLDNDRLRHGTASNLLWTLRTRIGRNRNYSRRYRSGSVPGSGFDAVSRRLPS